MSEGLVAASAPFASVKTIAPVSIASAGTETIRLVLAPAMVYFPSAFLHLNGLALQICAIEGADGGLGFLRIRHAHKAHPVGLARCPAS